MGLPLLGSHGELRLSSYSVIKFLRGLLNNHDTPPATSTTRSKPSRPRRAEASAPDTPIIRRAPARAQGGARSLRAATHYARTGRPRARPGRRDFAREEPAHEPDLPDPRPGP